MTPVLVALVVLLLGVGIVLPLGIRLGYVRPIPMEAPSLKSGMFRTPAPARAVPPAMSMLAAASQNYNNIEGPSRRGPFFEQLIYSLNQLPAPGPAQFSRSRILQLLGAPDLISTNPSAGTTSLLYYYTQVQPKDRCAIVTIGPGGRVVTIGMTDAARVTLSQWQPYSAATTAPAQ